MDDRFDAARLYARVSSDEQAEQGVSISAQLEDCRAFAASRGWAVTPEHYYSDNGYSGLLSLHDRPGLRAAVDSLGPRTVLVYRRRDRLHRCDRYDAAVIEKEIRDRGAHDMAIGGAEGTEDDSIQNLLMRWIFDAVSHYELGKGRARTREVMNFKRKGGERLGTIPYGARLKYPEIAAAEREAKRLNPKHRRDPRAVELEPDPAEQAIIQKIRVMGELQLSYDSIAAALTAQGCTDRKGGPFSRSTVRKTLERIREEEDSCPDDEPTTSAALALSLGKAG
jgi:DNA invertase Pin-like site-specific DNA recombinase